MSAASKTKSPADENLVPVNVMLGRVGQELRQLAATVEDMQSLIGHLLSERARGHSPSLYELQKFDLLRQELSGVADFVDALAPGAPPHWLLDPIMASQKVTLSDLAARLTMTEDPDEKRQQAGDCDFY